MAEQSPRQFMNSMYPGTLEGRTRAFRPLEADPRNPAEVATYVEAEANEPGQGKTFAVNILRFYAIPPTEEGNFPGLDFSTEQVETGDKTFSNVVQALEFGRAAVIIADQAMAGKAEVAQLEADFIGHDDGEPTPDPQ